MRASILILLAAFAAVASADFLVYQGLEIETADGEYHDAAYFFTGEPDCNDVYNADVAFGSDDVSGDKDGYVCEGCSGNSVPEYDITRFEINMEGLNGIGHVTLYKDGGYQVTDTDGGNHGSCTRVTDSPDTFDCFSGVAERGGTLLFNCVSDRTV